MQKEKETQTSKCRVLSNNLLVDKVTQSAFLLIQSLHVYAAEGVVIQMKFKKFKILVPKIQTPVN